MSIGPRVRVDSYFAARELFRALADRLRWPRESHAIHSRGLQGEELTIDVAWSTTQSDLPTLVVSSGLHGVEGFFGAEVQLALLRAVEQGEFDLAGIRLVLIHSLNPYGFAHVRRMDAANIDPNRNFLLPGEEFRGSPPGYAELDPLLNPRTASNWDWFYPRAAWAVLRMGMPRLKQAIAAGQYDFPQGLFFGGHGPGETQQVLAKCLPGWVAGASRVVHFDIHTGLGQRGTGKLLIDHALTEAQQDWLNQHLGRDDYEESHSTGIAYQTRGGIGPWCVAHGGGMDYLYACAEFGTFPPLAVLRGLRAENREHHWGQPNSMNYRRAKAELQRLFDPAENAPQQFLEWLGRAVQGLHAS